MPTVNSSNPVVRRALNAANASAVAKNARASVLVSFNAITAKGIEKVQAKMSADDFEAWAKKVGVESSLQGVWFSLMKGEEARVFAPPVRIIVKEI